MKKIEVSNCKENFFDTIGKEWMLITAGNEQEFNTMTASWGGIGFLWNKPVVFVFIRPQRYTFEFTEKNDYFTLSFLGEENRAIHKICGSLSGRTINKVKETGLLPETTELGNILFKQSRFSLECKKLYTTNLTEEQFVNNELISKWYPGKDFHKMYVAEIVNMWVEN